MNDRNIKLYFSLFADAARVVLFLQCDQPGDALCHAQLQDAPQGQREGGAGLQNTQ